MMTEQEEYYYLKGRRDGFLEGFQRGQVILNELLNKSYKPTPVIIKADSIDPKILKEMRT